jgi:hypothetical protein
MFQRTHARACVLGQHIGAAFLGETLWAQLFQHGKTLIAFRFANFRRRRAVTASRRQQQQAGHALRIRHSKRARDDRPKRMTEQHAAFNAERVEPFSQYSCVITCSGRIGFYGC